MLSWRTGGVSDYGRSSVPGQAGHNAHITFAKRHPGRAIFGEEDIAGNLKNDQTQGVYIGRLVELPEEDFRGDVFAVTFTISPSLGGPRCS